MAVHTESNNAQHDDGKRGDIQQCVNHTATYTHALPLGGRDLTPVRKIPFGSRHWSEKIKLHTVPV